MKPFILFTVIVLSVSYFANANMSADSSKSLVDAKSRIQAAAKAQETKKSKFVSITAQKTSVTAVQ